MTTEPSAPVAVYVAVGSNIRPAESIEAGLKSLAAYVRIIETSTMYASKPTHRTDQPDFVNGVLRIESERDPWSLKFEVLREVERRLGRKRGSDKHAARTLDLDLILYGAQVIRSDELVIPAPDIYSAAYVMVPLAELAPGLVLPDTKRRLRDIIDAAAAPDLLPLPDLTSLLKGWLHE